MKVLEQIVTAVKCDRCEAEEIVGLPDNSPQLINQFNELARVGWAFYTEGRTLCRCPEHAPSLLGKCTCKRSKSSGCLMHPTTATLLYFIAPQPLLRIVETLVDRRGEVHDPH